MSSEVSAFRLYVMRALYLLNFLLLGSDVWPKLVSHDGVWEPLHGVAFSFWAALSLLSGLGLRYPLQMLPLFLMQLVYKLVWLIAVAPPLWVANQATGMTQAFVIGIIFDIIAIPWPFVLKHYVKKQGDRWKRLPEPTS